MYPLSVTIIPLFMLWAAFSALAAEDAGKAPAQLTYAVTSFPDVMQREDESGNILLPEERIPFGEAQKQMHIMTATIGDKVVNCPLAYQDVAYLTFDDEVTVVPVIAFTGCPFVLPEALEDTVREKPNPIAFRGAVDLEIAAVEGNVAYTAVNSDLPFVIVRGQVMPGVGAVNTTWTFNDEGTVIDSPAGRFVTTADDATVQFQRDSVVVRDIRKLDPNAGSGDDGQR